MFGNCFFNTSTIILLPSFGLIIRVKVKIKPSLYTPWRGLGGEEV
jgi:hypothetical protein